MTKIEIFEMISYIALILGTLLDQVSTRYALQFSWIYETNPRTVLMMSRGLWLPMDILSVIAGIVVPYLLLRRKEVLNVTLLYPFVLGLMRAGAGVWNFGMVM